MIQKDKMPVVIALLAAVVYGASIPISKLLLAVLPPVFLAGLLYLGAGVGMLLFGWLAGNNRRSEAVLKKEDAMPVVAMVLLDVLAPILLLFGLTATTSASASLLTNFEVVATTLVAVFFFQEAIGKRLAVAITLITLASIILSVEDVSAVQFSVGSVLIVGACVSWGFENNCTRKISNKDPLQIVIIKGLFAGSTSIVIGLATEPVMLQFGSVLGAMVTGFVGYGLSVYLYVNAQRYLGAARTSAYYAAAPFAGVLFSALLFRTPMTAQFLVAFALMCGGAYLAVTERHIHEHLHQKLTHEHRHSHDDGHHSHHEGTQELAQTHVHVHTHLEASHTHEHTPDIHHRH